jgi:hypothetical protein
LVRISPCNHQAACREGGIDSLGEGFEPGSGFFNSLQDEEQILEGAREAVELPDDHHVIRAELIK